MQGRGGGTVCCKQQKLSVFGGGGGGDMAISHSRVEVVMTWEVGVHDEFLHSVGDTVKEDILRGRKRGEMTPPARQKLYCSWNIVF